MYNILEKFSREFLADLARRAVKEIWEEIEDFPEYCVSNLGEVYNMKRREILATRILRGVVSTSLYKDGRQYSRAMAVLVAKYFVASPEQAFNTPIHLDGDRSNCRADNLQWRTRPFAIAYHRQFYSEEFFASGRPILEVETGEIFDYPHLAAIRYGLIRNTLVVAANRVERVWPTGQLFEEVQ